MIQRGWPSVIVAVAAAISVMLPMPFAGYLVTQSWTYWACDWTTRMMFWALLSLSFAPVGGGLGLATWIAARKADRPVPGPALAGCLTSFLTLAASPLLLYGYATVQHAACNPPAVPGRPLRGPQPHAPLVPGSGWGEGGDDPYWRRAAVFEHASVAAFAQTALDLVDLGAPAALVERCLEAARQEVEHAEGAMALGCHGETFAPWTPPPRETPTRLRVAWTNVVDGWWNESRAAREAERRVTSSPSEERLCRQIATEERGHARLGREIAVWAISGRSQATPPGRARAERTLAALVRGADARSLRVALSDSRSIEVHR